MINTANPRQPLRIGVVGINDRIRRSILNGIASSPAAELSAVCSRDAGKAARVGAEYRCSGFGDYRAMLESPQVDAVFVATPAELHCAMSLAAIDAGKHVICEKPLATSVDEAEQMVRAARSAGVRTAVNFTYRSSQHYRHIARLAADGELGPLTNFRIAYWQARGLFPQTPWRDALTDLGPHLFESLLWWLSAAGAGEIARVAAVARRGDPLVGLPESVTWHCLLELTGGATGVVEVGRATPGYANGLQVEIAGARATVRSAYDASGGAVELAGLGDGRAEGTFRTVPTPPELAVSYEDFPARHMTRVAEGILGLSEFPCFTQGLRVQRILAAAARSASTCTWVDV